MKSIQNWDTVFYSLLYKKFIASCRLDWWTENIGDELLHKQPCTKSWRHFKSISYSCVLKSGTIFLTSLFCILNFLWRILQNLQLWGMRLQEQLVGSGVVNGYWSWSGHSCWQNSSSQGSLNACLRSPGTVAYWGRPCFDEVVYI